MKKAILVLDADKTERKKLCELLETGPYSTVPRDTIQNIEQYIQNSNCLALFWDIDTVSADNRTVRDLTLKFPGVYFFCISKHPFHPELKDAICYHIYACINRPIDPDELFYWLKSIDENELEPNNSATF